MIPLNETKKTVGLDLTEGSIIRQLVIFVLPLLLANVVQQLYNTVDMIIIGQYVGSHGTGGVSVGGEVASLITFIAMAFGSAGQIYVAQLFGAGRRREISETLTTGMVFVTILSLVITVINIFAADLFLGWLNCPSEAYAQAKSYMLIAAVGLPFIFGYNMVCGVLRGMGESKWPLVFIIIAAVSNVFMDWLLVAVIPLEAAGTAIATVIAELASFIAAFVYLYHSREKFGISFDRASLKMHKKHLMVLLKLGIPLTAQSALIHVTQLICTSNVNAFGIVETNVNSIGKKLQTLINTFVTSINQGAGTMIGQNLGAGKFDRVNEVLKTTILTSYIFSVISILIAIFLPRAAFGLFLKADDPNYEGIMALGETYLHICIIIFAISPVQGVLMALINGSGNAKLALFAGILDGVILRFGFSFILAYTLNFGAKGFFYGDALARFGPFFVGAYYYLSGKWKSYNLLGGHNEKAD